MASADRKTTEGLPKNPRDNLRVGGGRPKGIPNKTTRLAKDAIAIAADKLGGADRLFEWAQEDPDNEKVFWQSIYTKLIPVQVTGEGGGPLRTAIEVTFRSANAG